MSGSVVAGMTLRRGEPVAADLLGSPFERAPAYVKYTEPLVSTFMAGEPARHVSGEDAVVKILEERDAELVVLFDLIWADGCRGSWVAIVRPGDSPTPPSRMSRIRARGDAVDEDVDPQAELARARWLGLAHLAPSPEVLAKAAAQLTDVGWAQTAHGRALIAEGQAESALDVLERAQRLGEETRGDRAQALLALGRPEPALALLGDDASALGHLMRGRALRALGRGLEAADELRAAAATTVLLTQHPLSASARLELGETLMDLGRHADAFDVLDAQWRHHWTTYRLESEGARLLRAACLERLQKWEEAIAELRSAVDAGSKRATAEIIRLGAARALASGPQARVDASIDIGWVVEHPRFGRGRVVDVEDGTVTHVVVELDRGGEKRLPLTLVRVVERG
jgi:hypothetical protein